jgi:hypothetical protein
MTWASAFLLTQLIEMPVYALAQPGIPAPRRWAVAFGSSALTHPVAWFVFPLVPRLWGCTASSRCWVEQLILAEAFAVAVEAAWLRGCGVRRAFGWSLGANALSLGLGALFAW